MLHERDQSGFSRLQLLSYYLQLVKIQACTFDINIPLSDLGCSHSSINGCPIPGLDSSTVMLNFTTELNK